MKAVIQLYGEQWIESFRDEDSVVLLHVDGEKMIEVAIKSFNFDCLYEKLSS